MVFAFEKEPAEELWTRLDNALVLAPQNAMSDPGRCIKSAEHAISDHGLQMENE